MCDAQQVQNDKYCLQHVGNIGVVAAAEQLCPPT